MNRDALLEMVAADLRSRFGVHTILLYGSAADGTDTPDSDLDIAAFGPVNGAIREAFRCQGIFIDGFVYPEAVLDDPADEHLRFRNARILLQKNGSAKAFLARLQRHWRVGPRALPDDEREACRVWIEKMLLRIRRGDAEGHYRRAWLLTALLEDYFRLRDRWFEGPKKALAWLQENRPETALDFERALAPGASIEDIDRVARRVLDTTAAGSR